MRIKIDENLPARLLGRLSAMGHDVDSVHGEGLQGEDDPAVWQAAQQAKRFLITQDMDFSDIRAYRPGTHEGILLLRLRNPSRQALLRRILSVFRSEAVEDWSRCFVVASETKVRVRRPARAP